MIFEADLLWYIVGTYVRSIDISRDVLLEDVLVNLFGMWLSYILGHVVDELMRWLCCTSLISHI
jgi:hypothetical protein